MASIKKHGKRFRAQVAVKGKRTSKIFDKRNDAILWAAEQENLLSNSKQTIQGYTLGDAFKRYAKEVSPTKKGERWEVVRLNKLSRDMLALIPIDKLETRDLQSWIDRQTIGANSVIREMTLIQSVIRLARRWRWTSFEVRDLERPKAPRHRDRLISQSEIAAILRQEPQQRSEKECQIKIVFQLALETAMRKGEILGLEWQHVHINNRFVHLPDTKNGKPRDVPLSTKAAELLTTMTSKQSGRVFSVASGTFDQLFRRMKDRAGVSGFTFHDARHTAITNLAKKLSMLELARMVGHTDPRMLMIYFNESAESMAAKLD